jgi:hypothetical protein
MVIENPTGLMNFLKEFDASNPAHYEALKDLIEAYPHFHLIKPYYLKAVEQNDPTQYDSVLSHTAIATFDRQLLYEFLENQTFETKSAAQSGLIENAGLKEKEGVKPPKKSKKKKANTEKESKKEDLKTRSFSEWAHFLKSNEALASSDPIAEKFELFETFITKQKSTRPNKEQKNTEDLSAESLAATDELMTETLAKVFVKQKKYENALQAYQILSLKYPEKNSFFADQIKEIKRLQKLKE